MAIVKSRPICTNKKNFKISFSVLSSHPDNLIKEVTNSKLAGIDRIHLDYIDENFTPGLKKFDCIPQISKIAKLDVPMEVHLMANNVSESFLKKIMNAGLKKFRDKIFVHYEAYKNLNEFIDIIKFIKSNGFSRKSLTDITPRPKSSRFCDLWEFCNVSLIYFL